MPRTNAARPSRQRREEKAAPDAAIIAGKLRQKATMQGEPKAFEAAGSSTWVRGADGWERHAHSETILGNG